VFSAGEIVDGKYRVAGVCSGAGGMGVILFVEALKAKMPFQIVLKYCNDQGEEQLNSAVQAA